MISALSATALSDLIGLIYDCALDPSLWPVALAEIRDRLGFAHATLSLQTMPSGQVLLNVTSGMSSPWEERIADYGPDIIALWGGARVIAAAPLDEPVLLSEMNPEVKAGTSRNRYYLEWRKPQGLTDTMTMGLTRDATSLAAASFVRHESQGPIGEAEMAMARLLVPHLKRAVTISRLLDVQSVAASTFKAVMDAVTAPILITDGDMRLIHANRAGQVLLDSRTPLTLRGGAVVAGDHAVQQAISMAVMQAGADESGIARRGLGIPIRNEDGSLRGLHILPLQRGAVRPGLMPGAAVAMFVSSSLGAPSEAGSMIAALFDLSRAEARVFDCIASGDTVTHAAGSLGVSESTVRTHLLRIFEKTGVHRQVDLVKLASALKMV
jgi:DNA-binding CsgD family transcriptional regulator